MTHQFGHGPSSSSWNQYVSANKGSGKTMKVLGAEYRALKAQGMAPAAVFGPRKQSKAPVRKPKVVGAFVPKPGAPQYHTPAQVRAYMGMLPKQQQQQQQQGGYYW